MDSPYNRVDWNSSLRNGILYDFLKEHFLYLGSRTNIQNCFESDAKLPEK